MKITSTFNIWRYWLKTNTPDDVLDTLNFKWGYRNYGDGGTQGPRQPYVDINFHGTTDRAVTMMELRYQDWVHDREFITYNVEGDDGLDL